MTYFFFNDTAATEIYTYWHTLALHDALPISPATEEQHDGDGRNQHDADVFADEEHAEFHAGIFRMEARRQFGFGFGQIEWGAMHDRDRRQHEGAEAKELRNDVPAMRGLINDAIEIGRAAVREMWVR